MADSHLGGYSQGYSGNDTGNYTGNYPEALLTKEFFVADLRPKDMVRTTFLVQSKNVLLNKNGRPYLAMMLRDRTGSVDTRVWEAAEELGEEISEGDIVAVFGKAHQFQNRLQLVVDQLIRVDPENVCMDDYLPATSASTEQLFDELVGYFRQLDCPWTRQLGLSLLEDPEIASRYKLCPAAKTIHHAYLGGLLEHSLQVIRLVHAVAPLYQNLNKNHLVFGAAFHDFGKIFELSYDGPFSYTDEGKLVGHIAIGVTLVDRKIQAIPGFPKDLEWQLKHLILSHHGRLEYGSPKLPVTLEAIMLHALDDMDSRLQSVQSFIDCEKGEGRWTSLHGRTIRVTINLRAIPSRKCPKKDRKISCLDLEDILEQATDIVEEASEISLSYFRQAILIESKADGTPVTMADKKTEEHIRRELERAFPHHGILGEEFGPKDLNAEFVWTIDPIDGTRSFISGIPLLELWWGFCTEGEPVVELWYCRL